jgi:hypothetical protein
LEREEASVPFWCMFADSFVSSLVTWKQACFPSSHPPRSFPMSASAKAPDWVDPDADDANLLSGHGGRSEGEPASSARFNRRSAKCNDWWIVPIFVLAVALMLGIGYSAFSTYRHEMMDPPVPAPGQLQRDPIRFNAAAFGLIIALIGMSILISLGYLLLIKAAARELIWSSLIAFTVLLAFFSVYFFAYKRIAAGVIFALCVPLHIWYIYSIQNRIPFAVAMLNTVNRVLDLWKGQMIGLALAAMIVQAAWFLVWLIAAVAIFYSMKIEFENGRPVSAADGAGATKKVVTFPFVMALFAMLLVFFWTASVIRNVLHTTIAGVTATWYFLCDHSGRIMNHAAGGAQASSPVGGALRRACTTSFGSIVLASFVTAVVKAIRWTFHLVSKWLMSEETSCIAVACVCVIECMLRCIETLVEWVNDYALSFVAIYGKTYFTSAQMAMSLMKRRGLDAAVNDDITGLVLFFGALSSGCVCALAGAVMGAYPLHSAGGDWKLWGVIGFFLGCFLGLTILSVLEAAITTLFVCLADDPHILKTTKREVYDTLVPQLAEQWEGVDLETMNHNEGGRADAGGGGESARRRGGQNV